MVQICKEWFDIPNYVPITPGKSVAALVKSEEDAKVYQKRTTYFRRVLEKKLHLIRWSRP